MICSHPSVFPWPLLSFDNGVVACMTCMECGEKLPDGWVIIDDVSTYKYEVEAT